MIQIEASPLLTVGTKRGKKRILFTSLNHICLGPRSSVD